MQWNLNLEKWLETFGRQFAARFSTTTVSRVGDLSPSLSDVQVRFPSPDRELERMCPTESE